MAGWDSLRKLVEEEIEQKRSESCDTAGFIEKLENAGSDEDIMAVYRELELLHPGPDYPYIEPDDFDAIMAQTPGNRLEIAQRIKKDAACIPDDIMLDYFKGAWLSRCIGCALGYLSRQKVLRILQTVRPDGKIFTVG